VAHDEHAQHGAQANQDEAFLAERIFILDQDTALIVDTVSASSKPTRCFRMFSRLFESSHSN